MNAHVRRFARIMLWVAAALLIAIFAVAVKGLFYEPPSPVQDISAAQLLSEIDQGNVRDVVIKGREIHGTFTNGQSFATYVPSDPTFIQHLCAAPKIVVKGGCGAGQ
jgi:cell division protease FtsH